MVRKDFVKMSLSEKLSRCCALLSLLTLVVYCVYGAMYDYFDIVVFLCLALAVVSAEAYVHLRGGPSELLNLLAVGLISFGVGLFFLNSYPVWADRLNNITMYGSRGTLVPVVAIMVLCFLAAWLGIVSCFTRKGGK